MEVASLESGICSKMAVKLQETAIIILIHRLVADASHHPLTIDAIKHELLNRFSTIEHLFYYYMIDSSILHQFHLFLIIKNQRVIILAHEEMLHLPMFFFYLLGQFLTVIYRQREDNTTFLQLSVSCKIKHEIIKKLVSRLWHRSLLYQLFCRVHRLGVGNHRIR